MALTRVIFFLVIAVFGIVAHAAPAGEASFIDASFESAQEPKEALFLIDRRDGGLLRVRGLVVPVLGARGGVKAWRAGAALPSTIDESEELYFSVLVTFDAGARKLFPGFTRLAAAPEGPLDTRLLQRRETLRSWQLQVHIQEDNLARLRADAEVIGNLSRIVEVQDEIERTNKSIEDLERDMVNLQYFLRQTQGGPLPPNYAGRESQLTRQIAELAQAAKIAESQEFSRSSRSQSEMRHKLSLVEATRELDYDTLQRELIRLRGVRMQLEKRLDGPTVDDLN